MLAARPWLVKQRDAPKREQRTKTGIHFRGILFKHPSPVTNQALNKHENEMVVIPSMYILE